MMEVAVGRWLGIRHPSEGSDPAPELLEDSLCISDAHPEYGIVQDWQRDGYGRVRFAATGQQLPCYAADSDERQPGVQPWTGDWSDLSYPPLPHQPDSWEGWRQLINYLCQRALDLMAPENPTLSSSQKAALGVQILQQTDDKHANFAHYLDSYLRHGDSLNTSSRDEWHPANREYVQKLADKLVELEKQADLPNAEMKAANDFMRGIVNEAQEQKESHMTQSTRGLFGWARV